MDSKEFPSTGGLTTEQIDAIVKKLGGHDGALRFLNDETMVVEPKCSWREQDDVIYFSVESNGKTGEEWIKRLEDKSFRVADYAKQVLLSQDFKPTSGVKTEIAVLKGVLFEEENRKTMEIRAEADRRKLKTPNAEVACLIREKFTDKEIEAMGLWYIAVMHEPIGNSVIDMKLLNVLRANGGDWLWTFHIRPFNNWLRDSGFAFAVS